MKVSHLVAASIAIASAMAYPAAANAGEVTGNGGTTGMRGYAASKCAILRP